jgi:hypothetical protein
MKNEKKLSEKAIEKAISITGQQLSGYNMELKYSRDAHHYGICLNLTLVRTGFSLCNRVLNTDDVALLEMFFDEKGIIGTYKKTKSKTWVRCTNDLSIQQMESLVKFIKAK